jgi:hypothetical protein
VSRTGWLVLLAILGVTLRTPWALLAGAPWDDDALYYQQVAQNIVDGRGAVIDAIFLLAALPDGLPAPADTYWMPLPSRVAIPLTAAFGGLGGALTAALLGAVVGPLAWLLARDGLKTSLQAAILAGVLAASGGYLLRPLATADCHALTAALGGLGFWAASRGRWPLVVLAAAGLALTRSDGFLLAAALGLALPAWRGIAVAASGAVVTGLWTLRTLAIAGPAALAAKGLASQATEYGELFTGQPGARTLSARLSRIGEALATALPDYWGLATLGVFAPILIWAAWRHRQTPWVRAWAAAFILLPIVGCVLAPVVVEHGTLHRTGAALLVPSAVLLATGLDALVGALHRARGYPRLPSLGFIAILYLGCSVWLGLQLRAAEGRPPDCDRLSAPAGAAVFTSDPLRISHHCRRPAILYAPDLPTEQVASLSARYGVCHMMSLREESPPPENLPGWVGLADGIWQHPGWDGTGCGYPQQGREQ